MRNTAMRAPRSTSTHAHKDDPVSRSHRTSDEILCCVDIGVHDSVAQWYGCAVVWPPQIKKRKERSNEKCRERSKQKQNSKIAK